MYDDVSAYSIYSFLINYNLYDLNLTLTHCDYGIKAILHKYKSDLEFASKGKIVRPSVFWVEFQPGVWFDSTTPEYERNKQAGAYTYEQVEIRRRHYVDLHYRICVDIHKNLDEMILFIKNNSKLSPELKKEFSKLNIEVKNFVIDYEDANSRADWSKAIWNRRYKARYVIEFEDVIENHLIPIAKSLSKFEELQKQSDLSLKFINKVSMYKEIMALYRKFIINAYLKPEQFEKRPEDRYM